MSVPEPLVNNFQMSVDSKIIQETERKIKAQIIQDNIRSRFCNLLIQQIIKSLRSKKGMDGNTCIFSLRTPLYEHMFSYYDVGRYHPKDDQSICEMLNECFEGHDELRHFRATTVQTEYSNDIPTDCNSSESEGVCACCICCFCWFPCYCIPVNLIEMAFGKNIRYKIKLSLVEKEEQDIDIIPFGIPYTKNLSQCT
jgi:hypothetical protein